MGELHHYCAVKCAEYEGRKKKQEGEIKVQKIRCVVERIT